MILDTVKIETCAKINIMKMFVKNRLVKTKTALKDILENADTFQKLVTVNLGPIVNFDTLEIVEEKQ